jgi:putative intracellular protease/amidase
MTKRILIATTSHDKKGSTGEPTGAFVPEVAHPYAVFQRAGFEIDFASVRGGKVPLDGLDDKDPVSQAFLADESVLRRIHSSQKSSDVEPAKYDAIFFAGGHGAMWDLPDDVAFARVASAIYERGGVVSAVCHGPAALVNVRLANGSYLVAGKTVSAFTDDEERAVKLERVVPFLLSQKLAERGARLAAAPNWQEKVSSDARLVTGQNPASSAGVAQRVVGLLRELDTGRA